MDFWTVAGTLEMETREKHDHQSLPDFSMAIDVDEERKLAWEYGDTGRLPPEQTIWRHHRPECLASRHPSWQRRLSDHLHLQRNMAGSCMFFPARLVAIPAQPKPCRPLIPLPCDEKLYQLDIVTDCDCDTERDMSTVSRYGRPWLIVV